MPPRTDVRTAHAAWHTDLCVCATTASDASPSARRAPFKESLQTHHAGRLVLFFSFMKGVACRRLFVDSAQTTTKANKVTPPLFLLSRPLPVV